MINCKLNNEYAYFWESQVAGKSSERSQTKARNGALHACLGGPHCLRTAKDTDVHPRRVWKPRTGRRGHGGNIRYSPSVTPLFLLYCRCALVNPVL